MSFFITLLLTLLLVVVVLWVFIRVGIPVYRVERSNVIRLLEMVLAGEATESDWDVFIGVPIRHDPDLELIRAQCEEIAEREFIGGRNLFSEGGLEEIQELLEHLKESE